MAQVVVFRLEAPIAAFGDLAVGERRGTHRRPAASAILGLVAASLGIARDDPGHEALALAWRIALRADALGAPLADFQTAQTPPQRRGRSYATRAQELADKNDLGTIISRRDHWTDAKFTIALWPSGAGEGAPDAEAIARALTRPKWSLYAGRRACPLSRPLAARVIEEDTVEEAFAAWDRAETIAQMQAQAGTLPALDIGEDFILDDSFAQGGALAAAMGALHVERRETRRDQVTDRARWQFELRGEVLARAAPAAGEAS